MTWRGSLWTPSDSLMTCSKGIFHKRALFHKRRGCSPDPVSLGTAHHDEAADKDQMMSCQLCERGVLICSWLLAADTVTLPQREPLYMNSMGSPLTCRCSQAAGRHTLVAVDASQSVHQHGELS